MLRPFFVVVVAVAFAAMPNAGSAQAYPARPIRLIVPLAPASTADIAARDVARELSKALGQPVVVDNRVGAGGTIGTAELARARADGYTIGFATQGTLVFSPGIYASPGYDPLRDFEPVAMLARASNVLVVHPDSPASTVADVVAIARTRPRSLTFASGGSGSTHHLSGVLFARATGTEIVHVAYKSAPQGVQAVMSGEVTMGFFNTPMVIGAIKAGRLKALAVTRLARSELLPDVPTLDEQGLKGYEVDTWAGFVAPAGTPARIVDRLNAELNRILATEEAKARFAAHGFDLSTPMTPAAFGRLIAGDVERWVPLVKASGATAY